ncbi:tetratricopeptide repeat protein [Frankia sp. CNm7]|nr:tetratricopeptide repeat protein [Frankia nepalensis]
MPVAGVDVFVSHAGRDLAWAEWVSWQLERAGYSVELGHWDWVAGDNFIEKMNDALRRAQNVVALLSEAYLEADRYTRIGWAAVLAGGAGDPRLIPLRVEDVTSPPLLRPLLAPALFGLTSDQAREVLLKALRGPRRPGSEPDFPRPESAAVTEAGRTRLRLPGELPPVWNVPVRSPAFTGRDAMLLRLRGLLRSDGTALVQAMHGIGGVGKTQLAIEYAHRFAVDYDLVWWVDAGQAALVGDQIGELAVAAEVTASGVGTPAALVAVRRYLRSHGGWLLIFDNAEDPSDLVAWLPEGPGHILITSRNPGWGLVAAPVEVDVFARHESVALLRGQVPTVDVADADRLAEALGDLPLAVAQAAGLLAETGMPPSEYLDALATAAAEVLAEGRPPFYPVSLAAVVHLSVQRLADEDQAAHQLLQLCAFLAPEPVPLSYLSGAGVGVLPDPLATVARTPLALRRSMGRLGRYGLVKVGPVGPLLHRLVQAIVRAHLDPDGRRAARARVEAMLVDAAPGDPENPVWWSQWAGFLPHLLATDPVDSPSPQAHRLACDAVWYLLARGDTHAAQRLAADMYHRWRDRFGPDDQRTLTAANRLARAHRDLGQYAQARDLDAETLTQRGRVLGADHPDTLTSASNLARDLRTLGDLARARALDEDTLARRGRVLGADHPDTLTSASNLARDLAALGEIAQARDLDAQTHARRGRVLGADHPDTLISASNLARDLAAVGETARARALDEDTLARRRRVLGEDHPDTLISANNLAVDLRAVGEIARARALDEDTLARRRRVLGDDRPEALHSGSQAVADDRGGSPPGTGLE